MRFFHLNNLNSFAIEITLSSRQSPNPFYRLDISIHLLPFSNTIPDLVGNGHDDVE